MKKRKMNLDMIQQGGTLTSLRNSNLKMLLRMLNLNKRK